MQKELSVLCVEDVPADVVRLNHALRQGGLTFRSKRVDSQEAFLHELEHNRPDVILSDHGLPSFDGFMALAIAREKCPEVPFIFVTGRLGEQIAIETLKNGAADYVLKSNLAKLAPTIQRALREAEERAALKQKELELRESEERYRLLVEFCAEAFVVQCDGKIIFANRAAALLFGAENVQQLVGLPITGIIHPCSQPSLETRFKQLIENGTSLFWRKIEKGKAGKRNESGDAMAFIQATFVRLDGSPVEAEVASTPLLFQGRPAIQIIARGIPERKKPEAALRESEECYRMLVESAADCAIYMLDPAGRVTTWNAGAERLEGYRAEEIIGNPLAMFFTPDDVQRRVPEQLLQQAEREGQVAYGGQSVRKDGSRFWIQGTIKALRGQDGQLRGYCKLARDITRAREAAEEIRLLNAQLEERVIERTALLDAGKLQATS